jgi:NADPH:quinone reductase-like Zn-dependent oxidoreductase
MGAEVTGVASAAKLELLRSLGPAHVVDYHRDDFASRGKCYDLIVDIGGTPRLSRLRRALTPIGTAVLVGGEEGGNWTGGLDRTLQALIVSALGRRRLTGFVAKQRSSDLHVLTGYIEAGQLTPIVDSTYSLEGTAALCTARGRPGSREDGHRRVRPTWAP